MTIRRSDPYSISRWLPRFLRYHYQALNCAGQLDLLVASALKGHPNVVERDAAVKLMNRIGFEQSAIKRSWFDGRHLLPVLSTPPTAKRVLMPGTCRGALYRLRSPEFRRERFRTLEFTAVGSGWQVEEHVWQMQDMILAGDSGNTFVEAHCFREAVQGYLRDRHDDTVGGLIPVVKVTGTEVIFVGYRVEIPVGGTRIELVGDETGWTQRNATTGQERRLLPPWKLPSSLSAVAPDDRFDDLLEAETRFQKREPEPL